MQIQLTGHVTNPPIPIDHTMCGLNPVRSQTSRPRGIGTLFQRPQSHYLGCPLLLGNLKLTTTT